MHVKSRHGSQAFFRLGGHGKNIEHGNVEWFDDTPEALKDLERYLQSGSLVLVDALGDPLVPVKEPTVSNRLEARVTIVPGHPRLKPALFPEPDLPAAPVIRPGSFPFRRPPPIIRRPGSIR